jgi:hypothetical protein
MSFVIQNRGVKVAGGMGELDAFASALVAALENAELSAADRFCHGFNSAINTRHLQEHK